MSKEGTHQEGTHKSRDGLSLFTRSWKISAPRGAVVLVHGLAEHCGRYHHVAERLNGAGFNVYAYDHRGHGKSEGTRAHVDRVEQFLDDLGSILDRVTQQEGGHVPFLFGHSMGGLIATLYTIRHQPKLPGLLLSAPSLAAGDDFSAFLIFVAKVLAKLVPKLPLEKLDHRSISKDPAVVEDYDKDPLNYRGGIRAGLGVVLLKAFEEVARTRSKLEVPLLVMMGSADTLVDPKGVKEFYEHVGSTDKTFKSYEGLYHEVLNEPEKERVLSDMESWLDAHCG